MGNVLNKRIELGRATETDLICEQQLARVTGQPSLPQLIRHFEKFRGDPRDIHACGLHLSESDYAVLEEATARMVSAEKRKRYA